MTASSPDTPDFPLPSLDLAVVGNCSTAALVDAAGRIVWWCYPRFDSGPLFSALLDHEVVPSRTFAVELEGVVKWVQHYEHRTAVVRTRLLDAAGQGIEITDFAPRFTHHGRMFRPAQLVRRIRPIGGRPRIRVWFRPTGPWQRGEPQVSRGSHHLRYAWPDHAVRLNTNLPLTYLQSGQWFTLHAPASVLVGPDETFDGAIEETARTFEQRTIAEWRDWTSRLALPFDWQPQVLRAAITLKLCQFEETGAIVAALTTSVPEAPSSGRNWDYRYCWLRDAFFVIRALNCLAEVGTMEQYLRWLYDVVRAADGRPLQPLYGIGLEEALPESIVEGVAGYRGMGPVRIGNQAHEHAQHDVYGHVVLGAAQAFFDERLFRRADRTDYALLDMAGERAWALFDQPDAGMWELRGRARVHTSSSLMCWAAIDRLAKISQVLGLTDRATAWQERAGQVRQAILARAWSERRQAFAESFEGDQLDAGVLLMAEIGFIDPRDPRFVSTLEALEKTLADGPFMRRYEAPDDFGPPETSFTACSFWRIDALARSGRREQARELFETLLARCNPVGLLSEDIDPASGTLWGNFPQTYSMVGIVNSAVRLSRAWDQFV